MSLTRRNLSLGEGGAPAAPACVRRHVRGSTYCSSTPEALTDGLCQSQSQSECECQRQCQCQCQRRRVGIKKALLLRRCRYGTRRRGWSMLATGQGCLVTSGTRELMVWKDCALDRSLLHCISQWHAMMPGSRRRSRRYRRHKDSSLQDWWYGMV